MVSEILKTVLGCSSSSQMLEHAGKTKELFFKSLELLGSQQNSKCRQTHTHKNLRKLDPKEK